MSKDFVTGNEIKRNEYISSLQQTLTIIPRIYLAMLKSEVMNRNDSYMQVLYRGTSLHEIKSLRVGETINRITSATESLRNGNFESYMFNENKDSPVNLQIRIPANSRNIDF